MNQEFDMRTFRPEAVGELAQFLREEYPSGEISDERYLSWEYLDNPSGKAIVTTARNSEKKIVAQYALAPVQVYADGEMLPATLSLNTLTADGYRGRGLFKATANAAFNYCAKNGFGFTFGVPNRNSFSGFVKRLNFNHAGNLAFMAAPLKPLKIISSIIKGRKQKKGAQIEISMDEEVLEGNSVSFLRFPFDEERHRSFLNLWNKQGYISVHRSPAFLQWRYVQNPLRKYELIKLEESGEIKAIAVIRCMHLYGMKVCLVMDHISLDKKYSGKLFSVMSEELKRNNLELMIAVAASKQAAQHGQFVHSGFWNVPSFLLPQQLPFITRIHNGFEKLSRLNDLKNWHFSFGDYDVF